MDGCFDMMHYGHANALRQAKACCGPDTFLVVGLVNDDEIVRNKGSAPVMTHDERYEALAACKWVDEIIPNVPYDLSKEWVDALVAEHHIRYICHGDDPCFTADGKDAYAYAKQLGVYKQVKRTEGVSTTDIVGRMLLMTRDHHVPPHHTGQARGEEEAQHGKGGRAGGAPANPRLHTVRSSSFSKAAEEGEESKDHTEDAGGKESTPSSQDSRAAGAGHRIAEALAELGQVATSGSKFLPTARRIMQFVGPNARVPGPTDRVVYMAGGWDLFNAGHIAILQAARAQGDYLLVGVHDDHTLNAIRGHGLPILNLYERALSLLGCKYVDEVIIGAPWNISEDLIKSMNISTVVKGTACDIGNRSAHNALGLEWAAEDVESALDHVYAVPRKLGLLVEIPSPHPTLTALNIVERIFAARAAFQARYEKKAAKEAAYYEQDKGYVQEA